ncbi:hypothetical protein [Streptomyces colonosanans]|uniref:Mur ligase C-terminal domain-containing protein n=1 Tax=Streptomyces colonosanans TaxID=1428652 RepID=A0A1S2P9Q8_9ACTN|nr:hypothetical protein [Streptomyces colonosanans]OIJ90441.1 hypothetical protein BIV24_18005 [Streptomyces colonosanans]
MTYPNEPFPDLARPIRCLRPARRTGGAPPPDVRTPLTFDQVAWIITLARDLIRPGDIVLVKGSHSVGLQHTAMCLAQPDTAFGDR